MNCSKKLIRFPCDKCIMVEDVVETIILYVEGDAEPVARLVQGTGFSTVLLTTAMDPAVYDPLLDENNLILVGGWSANQYTDYYFPELEANYDGVNQVLIVPEPVTGVVVVSPDGKYVIWTKTRTNGTKITCIMGVYAEDTLRAVDAYLAGQARWAGLALLGAGVVVGAIIAIKKP